jgi:hypothetical protein
VISSAADAGTGPSEEDEALLSAARLRELQVEREHERCYCDALTRDIAGKLGGG